MSDLLTKSWQGFLRPDGRKGIRNLVLVIYTVECAQHVAHAIGAGEEDVHVIGFPGCYDNAYAIRLMLALARHPNVGAVLVGRTRLRIHAAGKIRRSRSRIRPASGMVFHSAIGGTNFGYEGKAIISRLRERISKKLRACR